MPPHVQVTARSSLFKRANHMVECSYAGFHNVLVKCTNRYVFFLKFAQHVSTPECYACQWLHGSFWEDTHENGAF